MDYSHPASMELRSYDSGYPAIVSEVVDFLYNKIVVKYLETGIRYIKVSDSYVSHKLKKDRSLITKTIRDIILPLDLFQCERGGKTSPKDLLGKKRKRSKYWLNPAEQSKINLMKARKELLRD